MMKIKYVGKPEHWAQYPAQPSWHTANDRGLSLCISACFGLEFGVLNSTVIPL